MGKNDRRLQAFPEVVVRIDTSTQVTLKAEKGRLYIKLTPAAVGWTRMTPQKVDALIEALTKVKEQALLPPSEPEKAAKPPED